MNKITVSFLVCDPAPVAGYNIKWRIAGSSDPYSDAGNFFVSPAIFYDNTNPAGTEYEGVIRSDCGTFFGDPVAWVSTEESGVVVDNLTWSLDLFDGQSGAIIIIENGVEIVSQSNSSGSGTTFIYDGAMIECNPSGSGAISMVVVNVTDSITLYSGDSSFSFVKMPGKSYAVGVNVTSF